MALIHCPECNKEISDKATACPNCGYPICNGFVEKKQYPYLPDNLDIGNLAAGTKFIICKYYSTGTTNDIIPNGSVSLTIYEKGIRISTTKGLKIDYSLKIHFSQIEGLLEVSDTDIVNKSVVGRSIFGGLILGPLGAIVGGISGIGTKRVAFGKSYILINFWNSNDKNFYSISFECINNKQCSEFVRNYEQVKSKYH